MRIRILLSTLAACASFANATSQQAYTSNSVDTVVKVINENTGGSGYAIVARSVTANGTAIRGLGTGTNGTGVWGNGTGALGAGVYGVHTSGRGVWGTVTTGSAVYGEATATTGVGVEGKASHATGYYGVMGTGPTAGVYGTSTNGAGVMGVSTNSVGVNATGVPYGVIATATDNYGTAIVATGPVYGYGLAATGQTGIQSTGDFYGVQAVGDYIGVLGESAGDYGQGLRGYSSGTAGEGISAEASGSAGIGIRATASGGAAYAALFDGDVYITGGCSGCAVSDEKLKKNVRDLNGSLSKVLALRPKAYEMKTEEYKGKLSLGKGTQLGLIAQELEKVVPEVVHSLSAPLQTTAEERKKGVKKAPEQLKAVNYAALVPLLIAAIQEQQAQIEALKAGR